MQCTKPHSAGSWGWQAAGAAGHCVPSRGHCMSFGCEARTEPVPEASTTHQSLMTGAERCAGPEPETARSLCLCSRSPRPSTHPHGCRDVSLVTPAPQQQAGPALGMPRHCRLCHGSSPWQLEQSSCPNHHNVPACLCNVLISPDLAVSQSCLPTPTNRPWFCGLLFLGSKPPVYELKNKGRTKRWSAPEAQAGCSRTPRDLPAGTMGSAAVSLWPFPFSPCKCCSCTSPGFSSAFVLLLVQTGESPVCLQPECEIPNGNRPSSQQGQHVPFGLT